MMQTMPEPTALLPCGKAIARVRAVHPAFHADANKAHIPECFRGYLLEAI
jgi:hypothetical protein